MSGVDFPPAADGTVRSIRKGATDSVRTWVADQGGEPPLEVVGIVELISHEGGTPLVVADGESGPRRRPTEGRGEAGHDRTVRRAPRPRHPDGDDHRRQPADGGRHRGRGRRRRLPGRGHPRGQDGPHPQGAGGRQPRRHDRRRHQRRPGAGPGRCRRGDEHRDPGRQGSREHGRPRLRPDEAHRDRRDRQAAPDHAGIAHDLLDRERRRQVLRHHPRDVRGGVPVARLAQHHAARFGPFGDPLGGHLQRPDHRGPDPAGPTRGAASERPEPPRSSAATCWCTAWAASSPRSSASSSST